MKIYVAGFLFSVLSFTGCKKEDTDDHYFKATVLQTSDVSCHLPILNFSEDSLAIQHFTKRNDVLYTVLNLATNVNVQNKKLCVSVAALTPEEEFPCNTLGIFYPRLKILCVTER